MKNKTNSKKQSPVQEPTSDAPTLNAPIAFWTMRIEPGTPVIIGKDMWPGMMVMKNHGPGRIAIDTGYAFGEAQRVELKPGEVRVLSTYNKVPANSTDSKSVLLEFDYQPKPRLKY